MVTSSNLANTKSEEHLVSVLLPAFREPIEHFSMSLKSILNQTYRRIEVLVILDDPNNEEIASFVRAQTRIDNRIQLIVNKTNLGLARSLNNAIKIARGAFLCRMDADDIADSDRIQYQLNYLKRNNLDLVGGYLRTISEQGIFMYNVENIPCKPTSIRKALRWNNCVPHPTWLGRRNVFEIGYRSIALCEDYDFLLRSALRGKRIGNVPKIVISYRMGSSSISRSNLYDQFLSQQFLTKCYAQGTTADPGLLEQWVQTKSSEKKRRRYTEANACFNTALQQFSNGHILSAAINGFRTVLLSRQYVCKVARLAIASTK